MLKGGDSEWGSCGFGLMFYVMTKQYRGFPMRGGFELKNAEWADEGGGSHTER